MDIVILWLGRILIALAILCLAWFGWFLLRISWGSYGKRLLPLSPNADYSKSEGHDDASERREDA